MTPLAWMIVIGINGVIILFGLYQARETRDSVDWFLAARWINFAFSFPGAAAWLPVLLVTEICNKTCRSSDELSESASDIQK